MGKNSIKKNYVFNTAYQVFAIIVPLIVTPYISRVLGAGNIGEYSYTYSIVSYFILFSILGSSIYGVKVISAAKTEEERSEKFYSVLILRTIISSVFILGYFVYWHYVTKQNNVVLLQGIYLLANVFDLTWYFQGIEKFEKITIRNFIFKVITIICIFIFVNDSKDLGVYIICLAGLTFVGNLSMWLYLPKTLVKVNKYNIKPFYNFDQVLLLFFPSIAIQLYSLIDKTLIGLLVKGQTTENVIVSNNGVEEVVQQITLISNLENGFYQQTEKVVKMALIIITSISTVTLPRIVSYFKNNDEKAIKEIISKSFDFVLFLAIPMSLGLTAISNEFVPIFFGPGYDKIKILMPIMSVLFIFMGMNSVIGTQYLVATGKQNKYTLLLVIGGIVNIILDILLISNMHSVGAVLASVIGECIITIIGIRYMCKKEIIKLGGLLVSFSKYLFASIIMFITLILLNYVMKGTLLFLMVKMLISGIVYFITLIIIKDKLVHEGLNIVKKTINKFYGKIINIRR